MRAVLGSLTVKMSMFAVLIVYVFIIFSFALMGFKTDDPIPDLESVNMELRRKYRVVASKVKTGLYIKRFSEFDIAKNTFKIDGIIWFDFNADEVMLDIIGKFSIDNGKLLNKSTPDIQMRGNKTFVKYNVSFVITTNLSFKRYPLEDHSISIILANDYVTPKEMYFLEEIPFTTHGKLKITDWQIHKLTAKSGYSSLKLDKSDESRISSSPKVAYIIDFKRSSIKDLLVIFVPMFSMVFFALMTFLMSLGNYTGKFRLSISSVTALLAYRFVIDRYIPDVGYFTTTDKFYIFFLTVCFLIFIFQLIMTRQYMLLEQRRKLKSADIIEPEREHLQIELLDDINSYTYLGLSIIFVIAVTYFVMF